MRDHAENDDDIVTVRKRDIDRWNDAADTVEKGTFLAKVTAKIASAVAVGATLLLAVRNGFMK